VPDSPRAIAAVECDHLGRLEFGITVGGGAYSRAIFGVVLSQKLKGTRVDFQKKPRVDARISERERELRG